MISSDIQEIIFAANSAKNAKMHAENLKTLIDHRRKGESLWLKKFKNKKHR